jgi:transcriptional regulator with XRE-family HTH domain
LDLGDIGNRLARLRAAHGVSASALARTIGISRSYLSRIEHGRQVPSLVTLDAIAQHLGVELEYFFNTNSSGKIAVHRNANTSNGSVPDRATFSYEALCKERAHKLAQPFLAIFRPNSRTRVAVHDAEYFRYVTEGELVLHWDGQQHELGPGDAIYYDASLPHEIECVSGMPAKAITIFTKPPASGATPGRATQIEGHHVDRTR